MLRITVCNLITLYGFFLFHNVYICKKTTNNTHRWTQCCTNAGDDAEIKNTPVAPFNDIIIFPINIFEQIRICFNIFICLFLLQLRKISQTVKLRIIGLCVLSVRTKYSLKYHLCYLSILFNEFGIIGNIYKVF